MTINVTLHSRKWLRSLMDIMVTSLVTVPSDADFVNRKMAKVQHKLCYTSPIHFLLISKFLLFDFYRTCSMK